jgi:hypothetical protein
LPTNCRGRCSSPGAYDCRYVLGRGSPDLGSPESLIYLALVHEGLMKPFPPLAPVEDAPDLFTSGHLWIQELVAGEPLRVQMTPEGSLAVADRERPIEDPPASLRAGVEHVERELDRGALLDAAEDPSAVVLYGVATRFEGVPYAFDRLPPFLGTDVWSGAREEYVPPDVVERTFERLGLDPVNSVEKEVDARHFDPGDYAVPASAWYDGPAAGVVFRNKTGGRAALRNPRARGDPESLPATPEALADAVVTPARVQRVAGGLGAPDFDAVFEGTLAAVGREEHARLPDDHDERAFRTAVAELVGERWG